MSRLPTAVGDEVVPSYSGSVQTSPVNPVRASATMTQAMGDLGKGLMQFGHLADQVQLAADELKVEDTWNQAKQKALDLAYDQEKGYLNIKGGQAIHRPDGVSLINEYGQKLQGELDTLTNSLGNDTQKRLFAKRAAELSTTFRGEVERHTLGEFRNYYDSVQDGKIKTAMQESTLFWNDTAKLEKADIDVRSAIYSKGVLSGMSPQEIEADQKEASSKMRVGVVSTMLLNNRSDLAYSSMNTWIKEGKILPADAINLKDSVDKHYVSTISAEASTKADGDVLTKVAPPPNERLANLVMKQESGGNRFDSEGKLLESPKGALGEMQVLPTTAKDPGYGVVPAKDNSPEELARVGRDYLNTLVLKYDGDIEKATAAYNMGPAAFDEAQAKANNAGEPNLWIKYVPTETQKYVTNISAEYKKGSGGSSFPTREEYTQTFLSKLPANTPPEMRVKVLGIAEKKYASLVKDQNTKANELLAQGQREIYSGKTVEELDPELKNNIMNTNPSYMGKLIDYDKKVNGAKTFDAPTYSFVYNNAGKISDADFYDKISSLPTSNQVALIARRSSEQNPNSKDAGNYDTQEFNYKVNSYITQLGLDTAKDGSDSKKIAQLKDTLTDALLTAQKIKGVKFDAKETRDFLDYAISRQIKVPKRGFFGGVTEERTPIVDLSLEEIPAKDKEEIIKVYEARGSYPSDDQILSAYKRMKLASK